jgi:thiol-disulfide isomerase/thioredoxin
MRGSLADRRRITGANCFHGNQPKLTCGISLLKKHVEGRRTDTLKRLAILAFMAALTFSARSSAQSPASSKDNLQIPRHGPSFKGKRAPNFLLHDLSGKPVSLKDYVGKPVIVNFWATWCPPCLQEMPWFEEFFRRYAGSNLVILGLSTDLEGESVPPVKVAAIAKRLGITYPILLSNQSMEALYGPVHLLPETFYINRKGVIVEDVWGHADKEMMEKYIGEIVR